MASWRFFPFLLLISSQISAEDHSLDAFNFTGTTDSIIGKGGPIPPCMQKMLPCQAFIKAPENPSAMCCLPLKEMLAGDLQCLCSFFNNAELLKVLNVTQSQALKLPKNCGADVDISVCNHDGETPPTGPTNAHPAPAAKPSTDSPSSSTRNHPTYGIGFGYGFAAAASSSSFLALLLSVF